MKNISLYNSFSWSMSATAMMGIFYQYRENNKSIIEVSSNDRYITVKNHGKNTFKFDSIDYDGYGELNERFIPSDKELHFKRIINSNYKTNNCIICEQGILWKNCKKYPILKKSS